MNQDSPDLSLKGRTSGFKSPYRALRTMNQQTQTGQAIDGSPNPGRFWSEDLCRKNGPNFSSWFKPDGNYCFLILDGHYQGSWTQSDLTRRWFSTLIAILRNHHFSRNSRWPENDQFSSKITENDKLFIYAHRDLMHIITHHWTLKLCRIFENFQKYYIIGWLKN